MRFLAGLRQFHRGQHLAFQSRPTGFETTGDVPITQRTEDEASRKNEPNEESQPVGRAGQSVTGGVLDHHQPVHERRNAAQYHQHDQGAAKATDAVEKLPATPEPIQLPAGILVQFGGHISEMPYKGCFGNT